MIKNNLKCQYSTWLDFNKMVFDQINTKESIDDKLKFLSISNMNFEEFNRISIAKLRNSGKLERITRLNNAIKDFISEQEAYYFELMEEFEEVKGVKLIKETDEDIHDVIYDTCSKVNEIGLLEEACKFNSSSLYILMESPLGKKKIIEIPVELGRVHLIKENTYMLVEDMVKHYYKKSFGEEIEMSVFRITRETIFNLLDDTEALASLEREIDNKECKPVSRLEVESNISESALNFLSSKFWTDRDITFLCTMPINLNFLMELIDLSIVTPSVKYDIFDDSGIFNYLDKEDIMLEHPFDNYSNILNFIKVCSEDPYVTSLRQTIYRCSDRSPIIEYLIKAAETKDVTIYVEIGAPNDEAKNINLVKRLKKTKVNVIYRYRGLTTHAKCFSATRVVNGVSKDYCHIGTGNYNESTAKTFIDSSYITSDKAINEDIKNIFKQCVNNTKCDFTKILVTQNTFRDTIIKNIQREIDNVEAGKKGLIRIKVNALTDKEVIKKLYEASYMGIKVELIVRGSCRITNKVEKFGENITVKMLVGDFLHHNRLYYFHNDGMEDIYVGSVDLVKEKIDNRVDFIYPVQGKNRTHVMNIINRDFNSF